MGSTLDILYGTYYEGKTYDEVYGFIEGEGVDYTLGFIADSGSQGI